MAKVFYDVAEAAQELGISLEEMEEMFVTRELTLTKVGTTRRLVRVSDVEAVLERVRSGGALRTRREFRGSSVSGALDRAGAALGVSPSLLSYDVLERGNSWSPGRPAQEARVAVDLPGHGEVSVEDENTEEPVPEGRNLASDAGRGYYSPEQVAILLGTGPQEINLRIYRKELPCSSINGYRWVPAEAVDRALRELSPPGLESPPKPFVILNPPDPGLGTSELIRGGAETGPMEQRISELEEHIKILKHELRLEKARRAQALEARPEPSSRGSAAGPGDAAGGGANATRSSALTST